MAVGIVRGLFLPTFVVAYPAIERKSGELLAAGFCQHPRPVDQRRVVANVLPVATDQDSSPIAYLILVEANDRPFHRPDRLVSC